MLDFTFEDDVQKDPKLQDTLSILTTKFYGKLTGSRYWGVNDNDSDYDVIVNKDTIVDDIDLFISLFKVRPERKDLLSTDTYNSIGISQYIVTESSRRITVIVLPKNLFKCWSIATDMLSSVPVGCLKNRALRRLLFTLIVDTLNHLGKDQI